MAAPACPGAVSALQKAARARSGGASPLRMAALACSGSASALKKAVPARFGAASAFKAAVLGSLKNAGLGLLSETLYSALLYLRMDMHGFTLHIATRSSVKLHQADEPGH